MKIDLFFDLFSLTFCRQEGFTVLDIGLCNLPGYSRGLFHFRYSLIGGDRDVALTILFFRVLS